jgi:hypothetical protein
MKPLLSHFSTGPSILPTYRQPGKQRQRFSVSQGTTRRNYLYIIFKLTSSSWLSSVDFCSGPPPQKEEHKALSRYRGGQFVLHAQTSGQQNCQVRHKEAQNVVVLLHLGLFITVTLENNGLSSHPVF